MNYLKKVIFVVSILLVGLSACLLYYKIFLNSDTLFLEALARDLFLDHGRWSDWRLTPAPAYFPDMLLYFLAYGFIPDAVGRIFFVSVAQVFLLTIACVWLARQIKPKLSLNAITTLILLICFTTLVSAKSGMWLYFYSTNNHFAALWGALISLGLCIRLLEKPSWIIAFLIVLIGGVAQASSLVFLTCFIAPGLLYNTIVIVILSNAEPEYRKYRRVFFGLLLCLVGSMLLGFFLDKLFIYNSPLDGRIPASIPAAAQSFLLFLQATKVVFSKDNVVVLLLGLLVASSFFTIIYKFFYKLHLDSYGFSVLFQQANSGQINWRFIFASTFLIILVPVNLLMVISSGGFVDLYGYRYLTFPLFLTVILALLIFDSVQVRVEKIWVVFNLVFALTLIGLSIQHIHVSSGLSQPKNSVAVCFSKIQDSAFLPQAGIADYWNARGVSYDLPKMNPILAMTNNGSPFIWMSSMGMIRAPNEHPNFFYNFAILRKLDNKSPNSMQFDFNSGTIGKLLPRPTSIYSCGEASSEIWFYKNNILDVWVKKQLSQNLFLFQKGVLNQVSLEGASLPGLVGKIDGKYRVAVSPIDNSGILNYGPYLDFSKGKYRIEMRYFAKDKTHLDVGKFEVGRFDLPAKTVFLQTKKLNVNDNGKVVLNIDVQANGLGRVEFRTWYFGHGELVLKSIKITRLF